MAKHYYELTNDKSIKKKKIISKKLVELNIKKRAKEKYTNHLKYLKYLSNYDKWDKKHVDKRLTMNGFLDNYFEDKIYSIINLVYINNSYLK